MQVQVGSIHETLRRVQGFLDTHAEQFASVNQSSARRALDDAVARLTAFAADQDGGLQGSKGETSRQRKLRVELRLHHMWPIAAAAKIRLADVPEFSTLTMPETNARVGTVIARATTMAETARKYESELVEAGLPAGSVDALVAATEKVKQSIDNRGQSRNRRAGGTSGLGQQKKRARSLLRILNGVVLPIIGSDEHLLGEWRSAKLIPRQPGSKGSEGGTAPASSDTTTPNAA